MSENDNTPPVRFRNYTADVVKLIKWTVVTVILLCAPGLALKAMLYILGLVDAQNTTPSPMLNEMRRDALPILLAFYGGMVGAACAVITAYFNEKQNEPPIETVLKVTLGGFVGMGASLLLQNLTIMKILYSNIDYSALESAQIRWSTIVLFSAIAGAVSRQIITRLQRARYLKDE